MQYEIKPNLQKILEKLKKKDSVAFQAIIDKIEAAGGMNLISLMLHSH